MKFISSMKDKIRLLSTFVAFALITNMAFAGSAVDKAWEKVEVAINNLENPATPPNSREETFVFVKSGLTAFDFANKEFLAVAPNDTRRWQARLFEAKISELRDIVGLESGPVVLTVLDEIINSQDASPDVKGEASGMKVMRSSTNLPETDWQKLAEQHLQTFPEAPTSQEIKERLNRIALLAKLKAEPFDLTFKALDGSEVNISQMRGKVVLLDFWATWCGPCVNEIPNLVEVYHNYHSKGLEIIGISLDGDKTKLEGFIKENGLAWPQYFDGKGWGNSISSRFGIQSIPTMWLIDQNGMLVDTEAREDLEKKLENILTVKSN